jgi:hypothetical protein
LILMAHHPSRRSILGMLTAVGAAVAGGVYFWRVGSESLIGMILARRFPGVRIDAACIAALTRDVKDARFQTLGRRLALEGGARAAGIVGVDALARWKLTAASFSQLERKAVTFFITGSDFLDVKDPKSDRITYVEAPLVCPNRFAEYD